MIWKIQNNKQRGKSIMENTMTTRTMQVNGYDMTIKEYQGKRVVTLRDIDACHNRPEGTARKRFNDNKHHFIENVDYYTINQPSEIRTLGITRPQGGVPQFVTLITESGYLMLVKSFTDDLAWDVQRQLVNAYFRVEKVMTENNELHSEIKELIKAVRFMQFYITSKFEFDTKPVNIWKKYIATPLISRLSELSNVPEKDCYDLVYKIMRDDFGFCESAILTKYHRQYVNDDMSTITVIANEAEYQKQFVVSINKLIAALENSNQPALPIESLMEDKTEETHSLEKKIFTIKDNVDEIFNYLGELMGDTSKQKLIARRYIYSQMQSDRAWKIAQNKYKCASKGAVLNKEYKYKRRFIKACNDYIDRFFGGKNRMEN